MRKPSQLNSRSHIESSSRTTKKQLHKRASIEGKVLIHNEQHLFIAPLSNLSVGGLFIDQLTSIPEGVEVRVIVKSPRLDAPIQVSGTVVRVEKTDRKGAAVEFAQLSGRTKQLIETCVAESRMETVLKAV